jgi:hypothetical protein
MAHHPRLQSLSNTKHLKAFTKSLKGIEKDFDELGGLQYEVEVSQLDTSTTFLRRLLIDGGLKEAVEAMVIQTVFDACPIDIVVPMSRRRVVMPYSIFVEFPLPMTGRAEYRRGTLGNKWYCEPKNKSRLADLKNSIPKVKMIHKHGNLAYLIKTGHLLSPIEDDKTLWQIESGYEGGMFTGGYRPRILKFLEAIPKVKALLVKWNNE